MMFGPCNAPSTFQKMMNDILKEEIATGHVETFIDDIGIHHAETREHRKMIRQVLAKLQSHGLYLKKEKCEFEKGKIKFLGLIISDG